MEISAMKSVADPPCVNDTNRINELLDRIHYPHLHCDEFRNAWLVRANAKSELRKYIDFPHIIPHQRENSDIEYACIHCGQGFNVDGYSMMKNHWEGTRCKHGFCNRKCFCGKTFETIDEAYAHYFKMYCLQYHNERQQAIKEREQKKEEYKQKQKEINANRPATSKCDVCDVTFRCKSEEDRHMNGKYHLHKANKSLHCSICNINTTTEAKMEIHKATRKHQKKAQAQDQQEVTIPILNPIHTHDQ